MYFGQPMRPAPGSIERLPTEASAVRYRRDHLDLDEQLGRGEIRGHRESRRRPVLVEELEVDLMVRRPVVHVLDERLHQHDVIEIGAGLLSSPSRSVSSTRRVWTRISPATTAPVSGSFDTTPLVNTRPPARAAANVGTPPALFSERMSLESICGPKYIRCTFDMSYSSLRHRVYRCGKTRGDLLRPSCSMFRLIPCQPIASSTWCRSGPREHRAA